ncbi:MAG TPA: hypothetical protein VKV79_02380, partial [Terriglobia bacterium]|nr:hypothetical protein [Terriglobia bacterium]
KFFVRSVSGSRLAKAGLWSKIGMKGRLAYQIRGEAVLHNIEAGLYTIIGLASLALLTVILVLPECCMAQAGQQIQRFPPPILGSQSATRRVQMPPPPPDAEDALSQKQKTAIVTSNFNKAKQDVAKLRKLAESLEKEVDGSNPNVLSLHIVQSASKIEKLAKKIKNESKDY